MSRLSQTNSGATKHTHFAPTELERVKRFVTINIPSLTGLRGVAGLHRGVKGLGA